MNTPATLADRASNILAAISDFQLCLGDAAPEVLAKQEVQRRAVERSFEIICAAVNRLPDRVKAQQPRIDWQGMANLNDRLHDYYYCDSTDVLCEIATRNLPLLKAFAERAIRQT